MVNILRTLVISAFPPRLVRDLLHRREEILEDAPRAEVDLGVDLHAGDEAQRDKGPLALPPIGNI
jgi:hypothetical protein